MKSRKNLVLFFVLLFSLSCRNENTIEENKLPYYQFSQDDWSKILNPPNVGTQLNYKNQDGQIISFKIYSSEVGKTSYTTGNWATSYSTTHFYYDRQEIEMWYMEGNTSTSCKINFQKYPVGSNYQVYPPNVGVPLFYGYFTFPLWNGYNGNDKYNNTITMDFNLSLYTMSFNGKTYSKVRIYESFKTEVLNNNLPSPPFLPRNVNKIYFDQSAGIIGFDDLNGKTWRLE